MAAAGAIAAVVLGGAKRLSWLNGPHWGPFCFAPSILGAGINRPDLRVPHQRFSRRALPS
jgi:hypothetical protein